MSLPESYYEAQPSKNGLLIQCEQFMRLCNYGISSVISLPFPHFSGGRTDRDWLILASRHDKHEPDLFSEKTVRSHVVEAFVLQQRWERNTFCRVMKCVDTELWTEPTPARVDLDFDRYPYQTELPMFAVVRRHDSAAEMLVSLTLPLRWNSCLRLELDYRHEKRRDEAIRLFYVGHRSDYAHVHAVSEELSGDKLEWVNDTLVLEMKPVYAGERHWWDITSTLRDLSYAECWLSPNFTYNGLSWKEAHPEEALAEGWIKASSIQAALETEDE